MRERTPLKACLAANFLKHTKAILAVLPIAIYSLVFIGPARADYVSTVLGTDSSYLLAYWQLNSPNDPSLVNGYTSIWGSGVTLAPTAPDAGGSGSASFDGSGGATIDTSLNNAFTSGGTMVSWVNLSELPSTRGGIDYVMGASDSGNDLDVQFLSNNTINYYASCCAISIAYAPDPNTLVGQWNMIAASYDSAGNYDLYWDGQLVATGTGAYPVHSNEFAIGYSPVFGGRNFDGDIGEVSVWNTNLSEGQIQAL
jgi:hypothetical protein